MLTSDRTNKHFDKNLKLVDKIQAFAKAKGVTSAQVALAWIRNHSESGDCGVIIPIPGATGPERVIENSKLVELSAAEKKEVDDIIASFDVTGHRQIPGLDSNLWT